MLTIQLPLVAGSDPVKLNISGAHIQYTKAGDGIMKAQLNGAIKNSDVQGNIIPNVAMLLSMRVAVDPTTSTNKQILSIFDAGGTAESPVTTCGATCKNTDGSCAKKGDGKIDVCEVATNSIISNVLAPDVQLYNSTVDAAGKVTEGTTYMPNKDNKAKDSLSLGLSFTAVKASF